MLNFILALLGGIYAGFALKLVWNWIPSIIFDLPQLSFITAIGLKITFNLLRSNKNTESEDSDELRCSIISAAIFNSVGIALGYIIHIFM